MISGFLITSHLISAPPQRPKDFARFWSRRALRLLPPVGVVILATLAGIILWVPTSQWKDLAREAATSMLYVQNWQLISEATNYLDAQRAVSPFQHFWSLSIEEQYYLMWPLLVGLLTLIAAKLHRPRRLVLGSGFACAWSRPSPGASRRPAASPPRPTSRHGRGCGSSPSAPCSRRSTPR